MMGLSIYRGKIFWFIYIFSSLILSCTESKVTNSGMVAECCEDNGNLTEELIDLSELKTEILISNIKSSKCSPQYYHYDNSIFYTSFSDWTSGFFPGILWLLYDNTEREFWKRGATKWMNQLLGQRFNSGTHDLGFMFMPTYSKAYQLTNNDQYINIILDSADTLLSRYNSNVGAIKSWDNSRWEFPVIIDNLVNLELLFYAWKISGNTKYLEVANHHLKTTSKNHVREDGSVYHIVNFDVETGERLSIAAGQGYSNTSVWARGQSWAILGYAIAYEYTNDVAYLNLFDKVLSYYLAHIPEDAVPTWDFHIDSDSIGDKDSSATFIVSFALIKMSMAVDKDILSDNYLSEALSLLRNAFENNYISRDQKYIGFTKHSIGHYPRNSQVDVTLIYGDYYYLKSLSILNKMGLEF